MIGLLSGGAIVVASVGALPTSQTARQDPSSQERFDMEVRADFFTGFRGDEAALERGMRKCEEALAKDPKNAEALVWHGSGLSYSAKKEFMAGNFEKGREIQERGVAEMNEAVALRPDDVRVLIPRAAVFLSAAMHVPSAEAAKRDFRIAAGDYEKVLQLQTAHFSELPVHARGELLGGLAEAWNGLGETEKSLNYRKLMIEELPETAYASRAKQTLEGEQKSGPLGTTCLGCHVPGKGAN
ncbi:MAG TPA: hypothetical protein VJN93_11680 [Candidatus Acidoferrum sp.]|nr:hypothetical protein [Candidatus Acidoferrum sp.]